MGTFFHPITIIGPNGEETVEALVDTGSTFSTFPRELLERLGVTPFTRARVRLADGQVVVTDLGEVRAEIDGLHPRTIPCAFGDNGALTTIGATALEYFQLAVDPDGRRLVPVEGWWA
jgi:clan AA aspartic protease